MEIKAILLERSFPGKLNQLTRTPVRYYERSYSAGDLESPAECHDPSENYARKVIRQYEQMERVAWEEEMILRSHVFKKAVVEVYNGRCAISVMKLEFGAAVSIVDAFHIVPFVQSYDDTIHNGIALAHTGKGRTHRAAPTSTVHLTGEWFLYLMITGCWFIHG